MDVEVEVLEDDPPAVDRRAVLEHELAARDAPGGERSYAVLRVDEGLQNRSPHPAGSEDRQEFVRLPAARAGVSLDEDASRKLRPDRRAARGFLPVVVARTKLCLDLEVAHERLEGVFGASQAGSGAGPGPARSAAAIRTEAARVVG